MSNSPPALFQKRDMNRTGRCLLCLETGPLTFEHIPPRRVFNHLPALAHTIYGMRVGGKHAKDPVLLEGKRGLGRVALCKSCNGKTASWYGDAFADWTAQCLRYSTRISAGNRILLPFQIQPLNVIKQIATMLVAVSGLDTDSSSLGELRRFILSPRRVYLPDEIVISAYLNPTDPARSTTPLLTQNRLTESCGVLDVGCGASVLVIGEVAFPPMGYVAYSRVPNQLVSPDFTQLCDLRLFSSRTYNFSESFHLRLPVRIPFGPVPGYYPQIKSGQTKFLPDSRVLLTHK